MNNFEEWCDNIDGTLTEKNGRSECEFPDDAGSAVWDENYNEFYVYDESGNGNIQVTTGGTTIETESGPFRHDRVNPPRQKMVSARGRTEIGNVVSESFDVEGQKLLINDGMQDSMYIRVTNRNHNAEQQFRDLMDDKTPQERREFLEEIPESGREELRQDMEEMGYTVE